MELKFSLKNLTIPPDRRVILHVDMDSFYASCELKNYPDKIQRPFIVGADPRSGEGRGVILACNYEAKKLGLHSAMPIATAWRICPNGFYVRPNFDLYGKVSKSVMETIRTFADVMEQVSIDEAYIDDSLRVYGENPERNQAGSLIWSREKIEPIAKAIKKSVLDKEKISCSIGASNSKIVAKIATDLRKPDGLIIVEPHEVVDFLAPLPVGKVPGIGRVSQRILQEKFNAKTISELGKIPIDSLRDVFGRSALWFKQIVEGREFSEVVDGWEPKSISGESTFDEDELDYSKIRETMHGIALDVVTRATEEGYYFSNVGIKIRFTGFETHTRSKTLPVATESLQTVISECDKLLEEFSRMKKGVRLIGVRISALKMVEKDEQASLLDFGASNI